MYYELCMHGSNACNSILMEMKYGCLDNMYVEKLPCRTFEYNSPLVLFILSPWISFFIHILFLFLFPEVKSKRNFKFSNYTKTTLNLTLNC